MNTSKSKRRTSHRAGWAGAAVTAVVLSVALPAAAHRVFSEGTPARLTAGQSGDVHYVAGGIGLDERAQLRARADAYNLRMMFAEASGAFLVPDSVSVRKGDHELLTVADAGPLLYVHVPKGTYTVHARYRGLIRTQTVAVTGNMAEVILTWPADFAAH